MPAKITSTQRQQIVELLIDGLSKQDVSTRVGVTKGQVSAVAAHMTMGSYADVVTMPSPRQEPPMVETKELPPHIHSVDDVISDPMAIPLGRTEDGTSLAWWYPHPSAGTANPHLLTIGASGFGKTYFLASVIAELAIRHLSTIIFDYGQGFQSEQLPPEFQTHATPQYIPANRTGVTINPLQIFPSDVRGPVNVAQRVADTFKRVYSHLGIQQHTVIREAVLTCFRDVGIVVENPDSWSNPSPAFSAIYDELNRMAEERGHPHRSQAATAASHISTLFVFDIFNTRGAGIDWSTVVSSQHPWVIQLGGLEHSVATVATEFLMWNLFGYFESMGPGTLRSYVVLDEAHRLSFDSNSPIERILREGRKFGLGMLLASQHPEDFNELVFTNTSTQMLFQLDDSKGKVARRIAKKVQNHSTDDISGITSRLPRGQAYCIHNNHGEIVQVDSFAVRESRW